jgi:glycosyltransferase involved in cell wall biosynthesis
VPIIPRISVITPVFNGEQFIEETVKSVLDFSKGFEVEYLVVNDGSTDETLSILENFGDSIKVIFQNNSGESSAVNMGISNSTGDFILVISADDPLFTSDIFQGVPEYFDSNPEVVAWYPDWNLIDEKGNLIETRLVPDYSDSLLIGEFNCLPGPGTFFRKESALQIGGRNTELKFTGDYDFWLRLSRVGQIVHRREVLAQWRMHPTSTSISSKGLAMASERIKVIEDFVKKNELDIRIQQSALAHSYYFAARLAIFDHKIPARRYLVKSFTCQRRLVASAKLSVVLFILLKPFSNVILRLIRRFWTPS